MDAGTRDFANPEDAEASPLAERPVLAGRRDRRVLRPRLHFGHRGARRRVERPEARRARHPARSFLGQHAAVPHRIRRGLLGPAEAADFGDNPEDADIVAQIRELIDTRVRPAVANDGGDIVYRGFDAGKVYLQMQGACAGCPRRPRR
jgi:hypothetical protein